MPQYPKLPSDFFCFPNAKNSHLTLPLDPLETFLGPGVRRPLPQRDQEKRILKPFRQNQPYPTIKCPDNWSKGENWRQAGSLVSGEAGCYC